MIMPLVIKHTGLTRQLKTSILKKQKQDLNKRVKQTRPFYSAIQASFITLVDVRIYFYFYSTRNPRLFGALFNDLYVCIYDL